MAYWTTFYTDNTNAKQLNGYLNEKVQHEDTVGSSAERGAASITSASDQTSKSAGHAVLHSSKGLATTVRTLSRPITHRTNKQRGPVAKLQQQSLLDRMLHSNLYRVNISISLAYPTNNPSFLVPDVIASLQERLRDPWPISSQVHSPRNSFIQLGWLV